MPTRSSTTTRSLAVPDQLLALLDTSCVIEYPDHLDTLADTAAISTLTVAELAYGLHHDDPLVAAAREARYRGMCSTTSTRSPTPPRRRTSTGRSRHLCGNREGIPDHAGSTSCSHPSPRNSAPSCSPETPPTSLASGPHPLDRSLTEGSATKPRRPNGGSCVRECSHRRPRTWPAGQKHRRPRRHVAPLCKSLGHVQLTTRPVREYKSNNRRRSLDLKCHIHYPAPYWSVNTMTPWWRWRSVTVRGVWSGMGGHCVRYRGRPRRRHRRRWPVPDEPGCRLPRHPDHPDVDGVRPIACRHDPGSVRRVRRGSQEGHRAAGGQRPAGRPVPRRPHCLCLNRRRTYSAGASAGQLPAWVAAVVRRVNRGRRPGSASRSVPAR